MMNIVVQSFIKAKLFSGVYPPCPLRLLLGGRTDLLISINSLACSLRYSIRTPTLSPGKKENDFLNHEGSLWLFQFPMRDAPCAFRDSERPRSALKLAEVGKPKSNSELQGIMGLAAFVLGFLAGV